MLVLEIEWLTGVCRSARSPADTQPDWPPGPDRIFSALVASWGARGELDVERDALEWLERQAPPRAASVEAEARTTVIAYVPPNDRKTGDALVQYLPDRRRRQPRTFPAARLHLTKGEPWHLRLFWADAVAPPVDALQALARDTSYVGHSASLVRCRFRTDIQPPEPTPPPPSRAPYPGRLGELRRLHARHMAGDERARPRAAQPLKIEADPRAAIDDREALRLGRDWFVLAHAGGPRPDIRAFPLIARQLRDQIRKAYPDPVPEWLSGHAPDGTPTRVPHLAVLPMANVGWEWSDGALAGIALVLPARLEAHWAKAAPAEWEEKQRWADVLASTELQRVFLKGIGAWHLEPAPPEPNASQRPGRYLVESCRWTTATPIALDRHPDGRQPEHADDTAKIIAQSCVNGGLPEPIEVLLHKHAAATGAPSARPPRGSPPWARWARPKSLANLPLIHATLLFPEPVRGPVVIGAGRFFGLGLCLPVADRDG